MDSEAALAAFAPAAERRSVLSRLCASRTTLAMPAYSASAAVYDDMVGMFAFEHWKENFERLEKRFGIDISSVADVACGSGLEASYLARRGARVFASDLSPHMLRVAAWRHCHRSLVFLRQDMRYLQVPEPVSLLNCATDAMNHLLEETDMKLAFASFYAALMPGGFAVFDMNTAWQLREGRDAEAWDFEVDGLRMHWLSEWDEVRMTATLTMILEACGDCGEDLVEVHRERAYDAEWIRGELLRTGFGRVHVLDASGLGKPAELTRRLLFVAAR